MSFTADDFFGLVLIALGLNCILKGELTIQSGITNGGENMKFIKSTKSKVTGIKARIIGFLICLAGLAIIKFLNTGEVLFSI